jgi:DNA modification methylase
MEINTIYTEDALATLRRMPDEFLDMCVTSPPYFGLRDYKVDGQVGLEKSPHEYVAKLVEVFEDLRRALKPDGTFWLNIGDSYANDSKWGGSTGGRHADGLHGQSNGNGRGKKVTGLKAKELCGIPWRLAFALQDAGWYLRQDIIWHKKNPMPESVTDRCTKAHEYIFLLTKSPKYYFDHHAIKEPAVGGVPGNKKHKGVEAYADGDDLHRTAYATSPDAVRQRDRSLKRNRNGITGSLDNHRGETRHKRSVWHVASQPFKGAHFAVFPQKLIEPCILAGCRPGGLVYDPFMGAGTTALVAVQHGRNYIGSELNPEYCELSRKRIQLALEEKEKNAIAAVPDTRD